LEISSLLSKRTEHYTMKRWLILLLWVTLTVDAQNIPAFTDTPVAHSTTQIQCSPPV